MDEKKFLLKIYCFMKCIIFINHLQNKKLLNSTQNGSKEFIFLLTCIYVDGIVLPPTLIYKNTSNDLQNIWLKDFNVTKTKLILLFFLKIKLIKN